MTLKRWVQRGCRFQVYKDYFGKLKIKPMGVCTEPQWETFGSLFKCICYWIRRNYDRRTN